MYEARHSSRERVRRAFASAVVIVSPTLTARAMQTATISRALIFGALQGVSRAPSRGRSLVRLLEPVRHEGRVLASLA